MWQEKHCRNQDREILKQEIHQESYQTLLWRLQMKEPFLRRFQSWEDVIAFMQSGTSQDPQKDEILRPIFQAHDKDNDPRWRAILLVMFWPGLDSIFNKKRYMDTDQNDIWQSLIWVFLQVICRINVTQRFDRLTQKIINDTIHNLHAEYRPLREQTEHEVFEEPEKLELHAGSDCIDLDEIDCRMAKDTEIRKLRAHLREGRISDTDFSILLGTRVYGKSMAEYARETGLKYKTVKKRRQQAETAIRCYEESMN